jgi:hypothetical protein
VARVNAATCLSRSLRQSVRESVVVRKSIFIIDRRRGVWRKTCAIVRGVVRKRGLVFPRNHAVRAENHTGRVRNHVVRATNQAVRARKQAVRATNHPVRAKDHAVRVRTHAVNVKNQAARAEGHAVRGKNHAPPPSRPPLTFF